MDEFNDFLEGKRTERAEVISRITHELNDLRQSKEDLEKERTLRMGLEKQIVALKEVSVVSNEMLQLREVQVSKLMECMHPSSIDKTGKLRGLALTG